MPGEGTHISLFLYLMKGPHDDTLELSGYWPLRRIFTVDLFNRFSNSYHHICNITFNTQTDGVSTNRVVEGNRAASGWGFQKFISLDTVHRYLEDDTLSFLIYYQKEFLVPTAMSMSLHSYIKQNKKCI